jgi:hypothetical protein
LWLATGRTWAFGSVFSRRAFGSGVGAFPGVWRELKELFTLPPGVGVWLCGPRVFSTSRVPIPFTAAGGWPWPFAEVMSLVAGGSALAGCLLFLPKRKDMTSTALLRGRRCNGSGGLSRTHSGCDRSQCTRPSVECGRERDWRLETAKCSDGKTRAHVVRLGCGRIEGVDGHSGHRSGGWMAMTWECECTCNALRGGRQGGCKTNVEQSMQTPVQGDSSVQTLKTSRC